MSGKLNDAGLLLLPVALPSLPPSWFCLIETDSPKLAPFDEWGEKNRLCCNVDRKHWRDTASFRCVMCQRGFRCPGVRDCKFGKHQTLQVKRPHRKTERCWRKWLRFGLQSSGRKLVSGSESDDGIEHLKCCPVSQHRKAVLRSTGVKWSAWEPSVHNMTLLVRNNDVSKSILARWETISKSFRNYSSEKVMMVYTFVVLLGSCLKCFRTA